MNLPGTRQKENVFFRLLQEQAQRLEEGVSGLLQFVSAHDEEGANTVERCEKEGDELRRILIDELHKTFVTPFDREDIYELSLFLDDVLDYAYTTVLEMRMLRIEPDKHLVDMVTRLHEAAEELVLCHGEAQ